ncbi:MAG: hypothetical protein AAFX58_08235, partial [Pseudomonadota bacterium]
FTNGDLAFHQQHGQPLMAWSPLGGGGLMTGNDKLHGVMDELDLDSTRVTGNQELPKVLYIVPWKQADLGDIVGRPVNTLLDEALAPVDRDVFKRQLAYYDDIYGETDPAEVPGR